MKKFALLGVAVIALGLVGVGVANAACPAGSSNAVAFAPESSAPQTAAGVRSYRSYSYEPRYGRSTMGGYRSGSSGYSNSASSKVLGY